MKSLKYSLHDKVFIKSLNKEGKIVGWNYSKSKGLTYSVACEEASYYVDNYYPVSTYMGQKWVKYTVKEEDLAPTEYPKMESHVLDAMNYGQFVTDRSHPVCSHEWQHYQGIMQEYDFCTKCDKKRK